MHTNCKLNFCEWENGIATECKAISWIGHDAWHAGKSWVHIFVLDFCLSVSHSLSLFLFVHQFHLIFLANRFLCFRFLSNWLAILYLNWFGSVFLYIRLFILLLLLWPILNAFYHVPRCSMFTAWNLCEFVWKWKKNNESWAITVYLWRRDTYHLTTQWAKPVKCNHFLWICSICLMLFGALEFVFKRSGFAILKTGCKSKCHEFRFVLFCFRLMIGSVACCVFRYAHYSPQIALLSFPLLHSY